jgi:hypothetical protein
MYMQPAPSDKDGEEVGEPYALCHRCVTPDKPDKLNEIPGVDVETEFAAFKFKDVPEPADESKSK